MPDWKLVLENGAEEQIVNRAQLEGWLDKFADQRKERPPGIQLVGPPGALAFGVGREVTVLNHIPADGNPPYHESRGSERGGSVLVFFFGGDWTEFGSEAAVAWPMAKKAIIDYIETGRLGSSVRWAEV